MEIHCPQVVCLLKAICIYVCCVYSSPNIHSLPFNPFMVIYQLTIDKHTLKRQYFNSYIKVYIIEVYI